jgi:spermidine synthase
MPDTDCVEELALRANRTLLYVLVFTSGMVSLGVELAASRLLDPFFGNSIIIWAVLIGLVLIYLTIGYRIGGRLADRRPDPAILYQITTWAAFLTGLVPFISRPILNWAAQGFANLNAGILVGSLFGVVALLAVPVTLMGCVSPFAIRLAVRDVSSAGSVAGSMYALSTLGSILGTFLPVLVLIPNIGTRNTFLLFAFVLLILSLLGLATVARRRALVHSLLLVALVGLVVFVPSGVIKAAPGAIYETESSYNYIQVTRHGDETWLHLNEGLGIHSVYDPDRVLVGGIWDHFLVAPFFNAPPFTEQDVGSLALIGSAAGTVAKQYTAVFGPIPIDGVEIDPEIIRVGREYFDMNEPNLDVIAQDGRYYLANSPERYDVIAVDAYRPPYIPFHLTTREWFQECYDHLTEQGVLAINVADLPGGGTLVPALASTIKDVFPTVFVVDTPGRGNLIENFMVVATRQPTRLENLSTNAQLLTQPDLRSVVDWAVGHTTEFTTPAGVVFTDDKAPIEQIVHGLILRYVTGE